MELAKAQALRIAKLEHQLGGHNRHRFGSKSESADQLDLQLRLEEEETAAANSAPPEHKADADAKDETQAQTSTARAARNDTVLSPGDECACGGKLRTISEDVTEELEYIPGRFVVNRIIRPQDGLCMLREHCSSGPLPSRPIERGRPGAGLLAHVLVSKYADHCPFYRQSRHLRARRDRPRSFDLGRLGRTNRAALLEPLADAIARHVRAGQAIFAVIRL